MDKNLRHHFLCASIVKTAVYIDITPERLTAESGSDICVNGQTSLFSSLNGFQEMDPGHCYCIG